MKLHRLSLIMITLALVGVSQAHAAYREMKQQIDAYNPPPDLQALTRPAPAQEKPVPAPGFEAEIKRMEDIKARWLKSISRADKRPDFIRPDKRLFRSLQPAGSDEHAAGNVLKGMFSLAILETLALLRSPAIKAAEKRLRATIEAISQMYNLDEILRQYTAFTEGIMPGVGPAKGKDPVALKFPFPGVLSLKGQIATQEVKIAREDLAKARRETITEARTAYWNLLYIHGAWKIIGETIELFKHLEAVATTRYEAGKTSFQDVIRIRIKRKILEEELITLREMQRNFEANIREVLNLASGIKIGSPRSAQPRENIPDPQTLYKLARDHRQELRRQRARIGKTERMIEMAETLVLPPYTLNLSLYEDEAITKAGSAATKATFPTSIEVSRGAGLPKNPWFGVQDAYLRETRQKLSALRQDLKQAEASTDDRVRSRWFQLDRARREMILYRKEVVNLSQSAFDVTTRGYESGQVPFADVIASYTLWLEANLSLADYQRNMGVAWAELEQTLGTTLK